MDFHRASVVYGMFPLSMMFAVLWLSGVKIRRRYRKERRPFSDKILRSPGYSLQSQIQQLNDKYQDWVAILFFGPMLITATLLALNPKSITWWPLGIVDAVIFGLCFWRLTFWHKKLCAHRLGFSGERLVATYLDELRDDGYKVFHDYPLERSNVDHVVVGPTGVFAIETKTRTKRSGPNGDSDYKVAFDGQQLVFPKWKDGDSPEQAKRQAEMLSDALHRRLGHRIDVAPVLAVPGWYVTEKVKTNLRVLNPKLIPAMIRSAEDSLSKDEIRNISNLLDEKCRDMEV